MRSIIIISLFTFSISLATKNSFAQNTTGVYIVPYISYDLVLVPSYIEETLFEDPFEFNVAGYLSYGVGIGKFYPIGQLGAYFRYGKSIIENGVKKMED